MFHQAEFGTGLLRLERSPVLPVAQMVTGMAVEEAAKLLPRLFNLCRVAQSVAARAAFGLSPVQDQATEIQHEILREHLLKFCLKLPGHFGIGPSPLPHGWQDGSAATRRALFGTPAVLPETPEEFGMFLGGETASAALLCCIRDCFAAGEATCGALPMVTSASVFDVVPLENSVVARQSHRPLLRWLAEEFGRGPFWRATARLYDAQDCMDGKLPPLEMPRSGHAIVPAARGAFAVAATVIDGRVADFQRVTPTDHLLAPGGILDQTLASLPADKTGMAPLILDILDPCSPVKLNEVGHA